MLCVMEYALLLEMLVVQLLEASLYEPSLLLTDSPSSSHLLGLETNILLYTVAIINDADRRCAAWRSYDDPSWRFWDRLPGCFAAGINNDSGRSAE